VIVFLFRKLKYISYLQCFGSGSGLDPDSIKLVDPDLKSGSGFEVLDVLFRGLKASPVAWTPFREA
jgi:hypothetical protein